MIQNLTGMLPLVLLAAKGTRQGMLPQGGTGTLHGRIGGPGNARALLRDLCTYLPACNAAQFQHMLRLMELADEMAAPLPQVQAEGYGHNSMERTVGILRALRHHVPMLDSPGLDRLQQMATVMGTLRSMAGTGGLAALGNTLQQMQGAMAQMPLPGPQPAPQSDGAELSPAQNAVESLGRMLSGMDDGQKQKLADMARAWMNQMAQRT